MIWWGRKISEWKWVLDLLLPSLRFGAGILLPEVSLRGRQTPLADSEMSFRCYTDCNMRWHSGKGHLFSVLLCPFVLCKGESLSLVLVVFNTCFTLVTLPFNQERAGPPNSEPWAGNSASSDCITLYCFTVFAFMVTFYLWQAVMAFHL